ncbi:S46 family peptidase [Haliscomenobacter sp.]|uniref:S46 family peptidase n=1 Tax=Haliscomenobacter sp. TaxID=2717303 RepID=UPI003593AA93
MKDIFLLYFLIVFSTILPAQEGFWSIDQLSQVQEKLQRIGLQGAFEKLSPPSHDGLTQATLRFPYGNAVFLNDQGLALGVFNHYVLPDTIWPLLGAQGIWLAKSDAGIPLRDVMAAEIYHHSKPMASNQAQANLGFSVKSFETDANGANFAVETHFAGLNSSQEFEQYYKRYTRIELLGVFLLPQNDPIYQVAVLLRVREKVGSQSKAQNPFIPWAAVEPEQSAHLVLGHPNSSSLHRQSGELQYAQAWSQCHQDLDRALGTYVTRQPFITQDGVFRQYEDLQLLSQALPKRALVEAEFRHQLTTNPPLKARYGGLLDSCHAAFDHLRSYAPAQVYTKGIVYSPCSFFEGVRLFTMWRGKTGTSAHRLPTAEESQYFPDVFNRLPPTENELLLPELLERYFTKLPAAHLAPYAMRQAIYAQKDYAQLSSTLLIKSKFSEPESVSTLLNEDFLANIDLIATDPAVQLVDSMLQHYSDRVAPSMEKARKKAYQKGNELTQAMREVLPNYPGYPDADHSLRLSYGTKLQAPTLDGAYWLSNAHLLEDHSGSPVIDQKGQLIGIVKGLSPEANGNAYYYDSEKSRALIWSIDSIRSRIATHPLGSLILNEWQ